MRASRDIRLAAMSGQGQCPDEDAVSAVMRQVNAARRERPDAMAVIGLCGAQGSGKSTLAGRVAARAQEEGLRVAVLSIDDIYLTLAQRRALAQSIHPLLRTRGVPGTHDVALGIEIIAALGRGDPSPLPRFDKARDDRCPIEDWPRGPAGCEALVLEGWCVGARPQMAGALTQPVNALEATEDPQGIWRGYVNDELAGPYQRLFDTLDRLVLLAAPEFAVIEGWRWQQEQETRARAGAGDGLMDRAGVRRFIAHYERLTRHILSEMPGRADLVIDLDADRRVCAMHSR